VFISHFFSNAVAWRKFTACGSISRKNGQREDEAREERLEIDHRRKLFQYLLMVGG